MDCLRSCCKAFSPSKHVSRSQVHNTESEPKTASPNYEGIYQDKTLNGRETLIKPAPGFINVLHLILNTYFLEFNKYTVAGRQYYVFFTSFSERKYVRLLKNICGCSGDSC